MITIGSLAKLYGQLPSYVRDNATIYDLSVANVMTSWENKRMAELNGEKTVPNLSQEEMMTMLKQARGEL